jgi:thioesterase domain-containing protein
LDLRQSAGPGQSDRSGPDQAALRYPCTLQQLRLWAEDCLTPGNSALNLAYRWRLKGTLCTRMLENAFVELIRRHETLRTALAEERGEPIQIIHESARFAIPILDLSLLKGDAAEREAERHALSEAQTAFDLTAPPLLRAKLLAISATNHVLLLTLHQTIADGWSAGILASEIGELYSASIEGRAPRLRALSHTYSDFAVWQREWASGPELEAVRESHRAKHANGRYFQVPPDFPIPQQPSGRAAIESRLIKMDLAQNLAKLGQSEGCTLFMAALACVLIVLKRYTGENEITVGTQLAGRDEVELENIVGYFANTIVLRPDLTGDLGFKDILESVRDLVLTEFDNKHLPYEKLIEFLRPRPKLCENPLFSVNFMVQRAFVQEATWSNLALLSMPSVSTGAQYDLNFFLVERREGWRLSCEYKTNLYENSTIRSLLDGILAVMRIAVEWPALPLSKYSQPGTRRQSGAPVYLKPFTKRKSGRSDHLLKERDCLVAGLWREVLGVEPSSPGEDFFDLGGDFWSALRLTRLLQERTGQPFSVAEILENPSLGDFTDASAGRIPIGEHSAVFTLQDGHGELPLVITAVDMPAYFFPLVRALGADRTVHAVQLLGETALESFTIETYDELVEEYVKLVRRAQPSGPYALIGYCAGGVLAYAVAKRLADEGEEIALLAIIDVWAPGYRDEIGPLRGKALQMFDWILGIEDKLKRSWEEWRAKKISFPQLLACCLPEGMKARIWREPAAAATAGRQEKDYNAMLFEYVRGLDRLYRPDPIDAKIDFFLSRAQSRRRPLERARGWDRLAGKGLKLILVPGDHYTMLHKPNVEALAQSVAASLRRYRRTRR